jgi:predicted CDP-diglyceride synthetase/phosphatidate cytidylyltransferase
MTPLFLSGNTSDAFATGFCGIGFIFYFMLIAFCNIVAIAFLILRVLMIIDCARKRFTSSGEQVIWILVSLVVPLGSLIYYFVIKYPDPESPGLAPRPMKNADSV